MQPPETRIASCCCGDVAITVSGEPHNVHGCHCNYCQRRTGSVWQVSCWYFEEQVTSTTGETQVYIGRPDLGQSLSGTDLEGTETQIDYHFCTRCGSTVYWKIRLAPGMAGPTELLITAVAVGCFADADFPAPTSDHYLRNRHEWFEPLAFGHRYDELPTPADMENEQT